MSLSLRRFLDMRNDKYKIQRVQQKTLDSMVLVSYNGASMLLGVAP